MNSVKITNEILTLLQPSVELIYLNEVDSTNNYLINKINIDRFPCLVVSEHQTKGKGQRQNIWNSKRGDSLTLSLGLYSQSTNVHALWSVLFAISACQALTQLSNQSIQIKWPNDLYIDGAKIAGILIENFVSSQGSKVINGIGINLKKPTGEFNYPVAAYQPQASVAHLYAEIANRSIENWHRFLDNDIDIVSLFSQYDYLYGKKITMTDNVSEKQQIGIAKGLNEHGFLSIETPQKQIKNVINQHHIRIIDETVF